MTPSFRFGGLLRFAVVALCFTILGSVAMAQTTISTGSIQGTVVDPSGAVVSGAKVIVSNRSTGHSITTTTNSSGVYTSGALNPGNYVVRVEAQGFKTAELPLTVQVGVTTPGSVGLQVGQADQVVEVQGSALQVNTEQATVQGVLSAQQIDTLPINGRNFLDLAQLEPGVQIQDGGTFDPTKNGFSSISFGGRYGRTARIEVDGIDISDETVGTTTQNIPAGAISEFQISQSSLDLSTELTSSGSVNVVTRSGTNQLHGDGFYLFRDSSLAAKLRATRAAHSNAISLADGSADRSSKTSFSFFSPGNASSRICRRRCNPGTRSPRWRAISVRHFAIAGHGPARLSAERLCAIVLSFFV